MNRDQLPAGAIRKCGTCRADIVMAVTDDRRDMPVNPDPIVGGTVRLTPTGKGCGLQAHVLPAKLAFGRTDLHQAHFSTCPQAAAHRRRPPRRRTR